MKKIFIIFIALITLQVTAQDRKRAPRGEGPEERMEAMKDLTPEEMATLQTKRMTLHLDLTEAQQKKVQALNLEEAKMRKAKMEEHMAMKEKGDMKTLSKEEKLKMMNERLDHQIAMKQQMKSILNEEQYKKWEASQGKMMEHNKDMKKKAMKRKMAEEKDHK